MGDPILLPDPIVEIIKLADDLVILTETTSRQVQRRIDREEIARIRAEGERLIALADQLQAVMDG